MMKYMAGKRCLSSLFCMALLLCMTSLESFRLSIANAASKRAFRRDHAVSMTVGSNILQNLLQVTSQSGMLLAESNIDQSLAVGDVSLNDLQTIAILLSISGYLIYDRRPRGSCRDDLVEVTRSKNIADNLGVVAKRFIPKDTTIGLYPGYIRNYNAAINSKSSDEAKYQAQRYFWALDGTTVLDPTNADGNVEVELNFLAGLTKASTTLSRVNEPCSGFDCNVFTKIVPGLGIVELVAERDIIAGEELFVDYGPNYDRSDYVKKTVPLDDYQVDKEVYIEPVLNDGSAPKSSDVTKKVKVNKKADSLLTKLAEKDEDYRKRGIAPPDELAKLFEERGATMFDSIENQELIDSMLGKTPLSSVMPPKETPQPAMSALAQRPESEIIDDDEFEQLLAAAKKELASLDDEMTPGNPFRELSSGPFLQSSSAKSMTSSPSSISNAAPVDTPIAKTSPFDGRKPNITPEQAAEFQRLLDQMTDEEVQEAFQKMAKLAKEKFQENIAQDLNQYRGQIPSPSTLPKTIPKNPAVRQQYAAEFEEIEKEFQKMLSDPLAVWQDLMKDPAKYMDDLPSTTEDSDKK